MKPFARINLSSAALRRGFSSHPSRASEEGGGDMESFEVRAPGAD